MGRIDLTLHVDILVRNIYLLTDSMEQRPS